MNKLQSGENYDKASCDDNYGVIGSIPLGFGTVHGRKEHEKISCSQQYKIALSFLEINSLGVGVSKC